MAETAEIFGTSRFQGTSEGDSFGRIFEGAAGQGRGLSKGFKGGQGGQSGGFSGGSVPWLVWVQLGKIAKEEEFRRFQTKGPDDPLANVGLGLVGPSFAQAREDPIGVGLPTALGFSVITPFTASDKAKTQEPEWMGLGKKFGF